MIESQIGCCYVPTRVRVPRHLGNLIRKDTLEPTLTLIAYFAGFCLDVVCKHTDYALPTQVRVLRLPDKILNTAHFYLDVVRKPSKKLNTLDPTLTLVTHFAGFCLDVVCRRFRL